MKQHVRLEVRRLSDEPLDEVGGVPIRMTEKLGPVSSGRADVVHNTTSLGMTTIVLAYTS